jgi:hypothetical protein
MAETLFDELKALCPKEEVTPDNVKASAFWSPVGLVRQYARLLNALPHLLAVVEAAHDIDWEHLLAFIERRRRRGPDELATLEAMMLRDVELAQAALAPLFEAAE